MTASAFPLTWPTGFPRTKQREPGRFSTTLAKALNNVEGSLRLFGTDSRKKIEGLVLSSNVTLGGRKPEDPGVAVWFTWDDLGVCIAVDRYTTVEANLQAIHHIIEARRVELRHGTLALVRASFAGFMALPAPSGKAWWEVLGVHQGAHQEAVKAAYRRLAAVHHPDREGGDSNRMAEINEAYRQAGAA